MNYLLLLFCLISSAFAKDVKQVEVVATHVMTREDRGARATYDSVMLGSHHARKTVQAYDLDTIIDGQHVVLTCDDSTACESPAVGKYQAEVKRGNWLKMTFSLPVSGKEVSRMYKIAGSW